MEIRYLQSIYVPNFFNTGLKLIIISHNKNSIYIKDVGNEDVIYGKNYRCI